MGEHTPEPDDELVEIARRAPDGDRRAFESLVRRHQGRIVADCRYLTRAPGDAEDLAQEVFVKAFFGLRHFEGRSSFRTWLQRIKVNHCLNHLKKREVKADVDVEDLRDGEVEELTVRHPAEARADSEHERERIGRILEAMSDTLRIPLIMRDMDQMSYEEIARSLGIGLSAVKMRIKRAREEFQRRYVAETGSPA